ncbi:hypothetical protein [Paraburkholderia phosphatilytica]|uniref:hypothetical protein n=1 Tax=Paraburkholderia phosphatilytica TaxID=2282883 RepID=UPI000E4EDA8D|nr:hypothetical protein [Paraburkholderia phosphatilytica]
MAINEYMLSHKDLVKAIIVHKNIHEGFWCLNINFNIAASHGVESPNPSVALSIMSIGVTRSPEANDLTIDAAVVNPWVPRKAAEELALATPPAPPEPAAPKPAAPIIASNAELLASLPSRFGRNIYGNVAVSFRPQAAQQGRNGDSAATNGIAANGVNGVSGMSMGRPDANGVAANSVAQPNGLSADTEATPVISIAPQPPHGNRGNA